MKVVFDRSFSKSLDRIAAPSIKKKLEAVILRIEAAVSLHEIPGIKKMEGFKAYYRVRIGEYRLGIELIENSAVLIIIIAHRKDVYRVFP